LQGRGGVAMETVHDKVAARIAGWPTAVSPHGLREAEAELRVERAERKDGGGIARQMAAAARRELIG
jgi:hypothetical protein